MQYFLFNLAALTYVIVTLAKTNQVPPIPALLLTLTGASAAAYAANKAAAQNNPTIRALTPMTVRPGQTLTIDGANFLPAGSDTPPTVKIGDAAAMVEAGAGDRQIRAIVPAGATTGTTSVVVTTSAGVASDPQTIVVAPDTVTIAAISPALAKPGDPVTIEGWGFYSTLDGARIASVTFDDLAGAPPETSTITSLANGLDQITAHVPQGAAGKTVTINVVTNRGVKTAPAPGWKYQVGQ